MTKQLSEILHILFKQKKTNYKSGIIITGLLDK